jgi:hypothetical protein
MKKPRKKVPYKKPSKRNPVLDIQSDAGRRAKNRVAEKTSDNELRAALAYPKDGKGKPIAGHLVKTLAANQLRANPGTSHALDFEFAVEQFLSKLTYQRWGYATTISSLWKTFLKLIGETDPENVRQVAQTRERDFRFCVVGHVHRLNLEYDRLPYAIEVIEIWRGRKGVTQIGVQRDGQRRVIPHDQPPEPPMVWHAGGSVSVFIAPEDLKRMRKMGYDRFVAAYKAGKIELSPRPLELLTEDTVMNVAPPTAADLVELRKNLAMIFMSRGYKPKRSAVKGT